MAFHSLAEMADAWTQGRVWQQSIHKTGTPLLPAVGYWADLSMAAGTPKYNAYVGVQGEFTPMVGTSNFGIYTGGGSHSEWSAATTYASGTRVLIAETQDIYSSLQSSNTGHDPRSEPTWWSYVEKGNKWISRIMFGGSGVTNSAFPANVMLLDYVGFYPLIDLDNTDPQDLDNTYSPPRHDDGSLQVMVVCTTPQSTLSPQQCLMTFINQDGNEDIATFYVQAANIGQINVTSANLTGIASVASPFVPLGPMSYGVKRILSIQMMNSAGGFAAFVLIKPLTQVHVPESVTPVEIDLAIHRQPVPEVLAGAYVNIIYSPCTAGTVSGIVRGQIDFIRST